MNAAASGRNFDWWYRPIKANMGMATISSFCGETCSSGHSIATLHLLQRPEHVCAAQNCVCVCVTRGVQAGGQVVLHHTVGMVQ